MKIKITYLSLILTSLILSFDANSAPIELGSNDKASDGGLYGDDDFLPTEDEQEIITEDAPETPSAPAARANERFADIPSAGVGSNVDSDFKSTPATAPIVTDSFPASSGGSLGDLEAAASQCTAEISVLYPQQKQVSPEKKQKFQCRIGDAHEGCEKIKAELANIKRYKAEIAKSEAAAAKALKKYQDNLAQVKETIR